MSASGKEALPPHAPSGPGRGRPKKVRPREEEVGVGTGIAIEVKRRRKIATAAAAEIGEAGTSTGHTGGVSDESETIAVETRSADPPARRLSTRGQKHPMEMRKQNATQNSGREGGTTMANDHGREGENQEDEIGTALDWVLKVHGVVVHASGGAAPSPGEAGQDESNLCLCCKKPEILRQTLVCDGCERSFHVKCLKLGLESASEIDDWICTSCSASYPESEAAAGISEAVREDLERKLFSRGRSTYGDAGVQNDSQERVCSSADECRPMVTVVAVADQTANGLGPANGPKKSGDDQTRWDSPDVREVALGGFPDLNMKIDDRLLEDSCGRSSGNDLEGTSRPESEVEGSKMPAMAILEAGGGTVQANAEEQSDSREPCTDSLEKSLPQTALELAEKSERSLPRVADESAGNSEVSNSGTAENLFGTRVAEVAHAAELIGVTAPTLPGDLVLVVETKPAVTPEESESLPELESASQKKLALTSTATEASFVVDCNVPTIPTKAKILGENTMVGLVEEIAGASHAKVARSSEEGEVISADETKLSAIPESPDILGASCFTCSSVEPTAENDEKQAGSLLVPFEADSIANATGRTVNAQDEDVDVDIDEDEYVDIVGGTNLVEESAEVSSLVVTSRSVEDEEVNIITNSETTEKQAGSVNKFLDHSQESTRQHKEAPKAEAGSGNATSTSHVDPSLTNSADGIGPLLRRPECQQSKKSPCTVSSPVIQLDGATPKHKGVKDGQAREATDQPSQSGSDDHQLKKIGQDTLQQLGDSIKEKHGLLLAEGWEVEVKRRRNEKHLDKYFISPQKQRFRSRIEVLKHLGLWDGSRLSFSDGPRGKCDLQSVKPKDNPWLSLIRKLDKGKEELQLPIKCGELTIHSLGMIDLRPGYWNELHIWPVGYQCSWHDQNTASLCISEVTDGGSSGPIFRVSRKQCPVVGNRADSEGNAVTTSPGSSDLIMTDQLTCGGNKFMPTCGPHGAESPQIIVSDHEDSYRAFLGHNGSFPSHENTPARGDSTISAESARLGDSIGEFSVEAKSTDEAWRLYAEQFVERCRKVPALLETLLKTSPHGRTESESTVPVPIENLDHGLVEKLGEDRFGFNETLVIGLIERLVHADMCLGYRSLRQRGLSWEEEDPVQAVTPHRLRFREKARKHKKPPEVLAEDRSEATEPVEVNNKDEVEATVLVGGRPPPPSGESLRLKLPSQYVGDVLQIWEFLSRFSNLIGFSQPPLLEDLEEGLTCGTATESGRGDFNDTHLSRNGGTMVEKRLGEASDVAPRSTNGEAGSPQTPSRGRQFGSPQVPSSKQTSQQCRNHGCGMEDDVKTAGSPSQDTNSAMGVEPNHTKGEASCADVEPKSPRTKAMVESGLVAAASVHVPLIKYLLSALQTKICGFEELPGDSEDKHKRGRKRIRDIVSPSTLGREKLIGSFSVNEMTWPEVARRYIISLPRVAKIGEAAEFGREECMKVLRCIQGDGGVLCGALDGVAGMEIDAQLLAEAEKEISVLLRGNEDTAAPATPPQTSTSKEAEDPRGQDPSGECAIWVKLLDPIAKLPTNVGSRIRNRVIDALAANPPPWAAEMLTYSISKKVYKGNASGPTKRAVMEVLQRYRGEDPDPKIKKTKKQRKRVLPSPEVVMQRCRIVLRQVATADTLRIVSKGYRCMTNFYESEGEGLLARPLDFRAIDLRLGAGAYGTSPDSFAADVRQIWKNVASLYEDSSIEASAAVELAQLFENLYNKQVIVFQRGGDQGAVAGPDGKGVDHSVEGTPQNPTGGKTPGSDIEKPVKAPWEDDSCQVCGIDDDHDNVLLCDGCDAEYHIYCLKPPLQEIPDGNWYCHSCVAVDKGFLEAPSVSESTAETKTLDKQEEHYQLSGQYEDFAEKDQLIGSDLSAQTYPRELIQKLAGTDYWHLTLAEKVHLLKWLCDQALETPKLRSHLEKSMEVALDLQQKLKTLLAERRRNSDLDEAKPEIMKEGSREVNILPVLQSRGAHLNRPDEYSEETSVQVDVLDGPSVSGLSTGTSGTSKKVMSDLTDFVWPLGSAPPTELGIDGVKERSRGSHLSTKVPQTEHEEKAVAEGQLVGNPVKLMVVGLPPDSALPNNSGEELNEGSHGGHGEHAENMECEDLKVVDIPNGLSSDKHRRLPEGLVQTKSQIYFEPRNISSLFEEGIGATAQCEKNETLSCPEVEVEVKVGETTLPRSSYKVLDLEIERMKTKLMLVNSRRDLLGRDDNGRRYWGLCGSKTTPWLAVETADVNHPETVEIKERLAAGTEEQQPVGITTGLPTVESSSRNKTWTKRCDLSMPPESTDEPSDDVREKKDEAVHASEVKGREQDEHVWFIYSNEPVLDQLIGWLSPISNQEKLLKASLQQWRSLLLLYKGAEAGQAGGVREQSTARFDSTGWGSKTTDDRALPAQDLGSRITSAMPVLKASQILEWKFGQYSDSLVKGSATAGASKRGRKRKIHHMSKLSRCDCLEPIWPARYHCTVCHTTYDSEVEYLGHTTGGNCSNSRAKVFQLQGDTRAGKKSCHNSKSISASKVLQSTHSEPPSAVVGGPPDVSKMPMVVHESMRDRINRIGFIADNGPIFTPALAFAPAFDPALMMFDSSVRSSLQWSGGSAGILDSIAVGATSFISHGEVESSMEGFGLFIKSSHDLPGRSVEVSEGTEIVKTAGNFHGGILAPSAGSRIQDNAGPLALDVEGIVTKEGPQLNLLVVPEPTLARTSSGPLNLSQEPIDHLSMYKISKNFKVTGKQLTISAASLRTFETEEDLDRLQQLKIKLLDIEAALALDMSQSARSYPRRRQAWRALLKQAKSIYKMVQAFIILEQMICADFLSISWCYWSSLTVAAKTATLSSLYLRTYALDAAIEYEKSKTYTGADLTSFDLKPGKKDKEREDNKNSQSTKSTSKKKESTKKKEDVILIS